jgi:predicted DNA-binding protein with PD1-like motif
MKQLKFRYEEGQSVIEEFKKDIAASGIKSGTITAVVGALKDFTIVTIRQNSETIPPEHFEKKFDNNVELTGNGVIRDGKPHIHMTGGLEGGAALSGHLIEGTVTYFVEIMVLIG